MNYAQMEKTIKQFNVACKMLVESSGGCLLCRGRTRQCLGCNGRAFKRLNR